MPRSVLTITAVLMLLLGVVAAPAGADHHPSIATPKVMTLNLYVGADLGSFDPGLILATVLATDFPERAPTIAKEIDRRDPDLIGLQEVSDISVTFATSGICDANKPGPAVPGQPQLDYLTLLLDALTEEGEDYVVASEVTNAKVSLPIAIGDTVVCGNLIDRDVILARTSTTKTSDPENGHYGVNFTVQLPSFPPIEFTRGWTTVVAEVRGATFTFANTHLEVGPDPMTGEGFCSTKEGIVPCQIPQAEELIGILAGSAHPTILVGDFNAEQGTEAYNVVADAGFVDSWDVRLLGIAQQENTCCQAENLMNPFSQHSQRIDLILVRVDSEVTSLSTVFFDRFWEKTPNGLWPSDHGGVVARLLYSQS